MWSKQLSLEVCSWLWCNWGGGICQYFSFRTLVLHFKYFWTDIVLNYPLFPLCVPVITGTCFAELFKITIIQGRVHFWKPTAVLRSISSTHYHCLLKYKNFKCLPGFQELSTKFSLGLIDLKNLLWVVGFIWSGSQTETKAPSTKLTNHIRLGCTHVNWSFAYPNIHISGLDYSKQDGRQILLHWYDK